MQERVKVMRSISQIRRNAHKIDGLRSEQLTIKHEDFVLVIGFWCRSGRDVRWLWQSNLSANLYQICIKLITKGYELIIDVRNGLGADRTGALM